MLEIFLTASDFAVEESKSGKQAVRMCGSIKPDLVLLDLGLPDMDGKDVIAKIREWSQVPIIVLSVRAMDEEVVAALKQAQTITSLSHSMPACWLHVSKRICAKQSCAKVASRN